MKSVRAMRLLLMERAGGRRRRGKRRDNNMVKIKISGAYTLHRFYCMLCCSGSPTQTQPTVYKDTAFSTIS